MRRRSGAYKKKYMGTCPGSGERLWDTKRRVQTGELWLYVCDRCHQLIHRRTDGTAPTHTRWEYPL